MKDQHDLYHADPEQSRQYGTTALMLNFEGFVACIRCGAAFLMIYTYTQIPVRYSLLPGSAVKVKAAIVNGTLCVSLGATEAVLQQNDWSLHRRCTLS